MTHGRPPRSDAELLARTRVLIAFVVIYLICMGFMALGDMITIGTPNLLYSRLATLPFFLLLVRLWIKLIRVTPPTILKQARNLVGLGKLDAACDRYEQLIPQGAEMGNVDRARRILQDGLAVSVAQEAQLEIGRCNLLAGRLDLAVEQLAAVFAQLPARADIAIELAEALSRRGEDHRAAQVLRQGQPYMDAMDKRSLTDQPTLQKLLDTPFPTRSVFAAKILKEQNPCFLIPCINFRQCNIAGSQVVAYPPCRT